MHIYMPFHNYCSKVSLVLQLSYLPYRRDLCRKWCADRKMENNSGLIVLLAVVSCCPSVPNVKCWENDTLGCFLQLSLLAPAEQIALGVI